MGGRSGRGRPASTCCRGPHSSRRSATASASTPAASANAGHFPAGSSARSGLHSPEAADATPAAASAQAARGSPLEGGVGGYQRAVTRVVGSAPKGRATSAPAAAPRERSSSELG